MRRRLEHRWAQRKELHVGRVEIDLLGVRGVPERDRENCGEELEEKSLH
jgi:hypothetical protein